MSIPSVDEWIFRCVKHLILECYRGDVRQKTFIENVLKYVRKSSRTDNWERKKVSRRIDPWRVGCTGMCSGVGRFYDQKKWKTKT